MTILPNPSMTALPVLFRRVTLPVLLVSDVVRIECQKAAQQPPEQSTFLPSTGCKWKIYSVRPVKLLLKNLTNTTEKKESTVFPDCLPERGEINLTQNISNKFSYFRCNLSGSLAKNFNTKHLSPGLRIV